MTKSAEIDNSLFCNANGDVSLGDGTGWADITYSRDELNTTHWTQYSDLSGLLDLHSLQYNAVIDEVEITILLFIIFAKSNSIYLSMSIIKLNIR